MKQLNLGLQGSQTPIHRERDCPKNVSFGAWSSFLDDVWSDYGLSPFTKCAFDLCLGCCLQFSIKPIGKEVLEDI